MVWYTSAQKCGDMPCAINAPAHDRLVSHAFLICCVIISVFALVLCVPVSARGNTREAQNVDRKTHV